MAEKESSPIQQEFEYKAEMKQLLNLIIHSLYSKPDIFIRELVSNASDALNKYRFLRLTNNEVLNPEEELKIIITLDKETGVFSIEDNGIGMEKDDLINSIGTVAGSGTLKFLEQMKENPQGLDSQLIGKFGVGFYSVFMATDFVTIETRHAIAGSKGYKWQSAGEDKFTIEEIEKETKGTKISFKLKDEHKQYADDFTVKSILTKYSNFVDFPLYLGEEKINKVTAIWQRKKEEVSVEELDEFYKFISNDYQAPLGHLHLSLEGTINFKALVFIPETAPLQLFGENVEKSLHLYSSKVFIQDDAKELLPDYLRFVKGVVDTEDLPLNVSREATQNSPIMTKIRNVTSKIIALLEEWAEKNVEKYEKFYKNFGSLFKTGINSDFTNKAKITELLRFESSSTKPGEMTSFNGYVSRLKPDQKDIYYVSGPHRDQIEKSPNIEYFRKNDIEVIYLTDPVDMFTIPYIRDYDGKELKSIEKSDLDFNKTEAIEQSNKEAVDKLIERFKIALADKVEDVITSKRLVNSPATLVVGKEGLDPHMEKMMQMMDKQFTASKRILEVNPTHPLISNLASKLAANESDEVIDKTIMQIFEASMLIEGYMKSPVEFVNRMYEFMEKATK